MSCCDAVFSVSSLLQGKDDDKEELVKIASRYSERPTRTGMWFLLHQSHTNDILSQAGDYVLDGPVNIWEDFFKDHPSRDDICQEFVSVRLDPEFIYNNTDLVRMASYRWQGVEGVGQSGKEYRAPKNYTWFLSWLKEHGKIGWMDFMANIVVNVETAETVSYMGSFFAKLQTIGEWMILPDDLELAMKRAWIYQESTFGPLSNTAMEGMLNKIRKLGTKLTTKVYPLSKAQKDTIKFLHLCEHLSKLLDRRGYYAYAKEHDFLKQRQYDHYGGLPHNNMNQNVTAFVLERIFATRTIELDREDSYDSRGRFISCCCLRRRLKGGADIQQRPNFPSEFGHDSDSNEEPGFDQFVTNSNSHDDGMQLVQEKPSIFAQTPLVGGADVQQQPNIANDNDKQKVQQALDETSYSKENVDNLSQEDKDSVFEQKVHEIICSGYTKGYTAMYHLCDFFLSPRDKNFDKVYEAMMTIFTQQTWINCDTPEAFFEQIGDPLLATYSALEVSYESDRKDSVTKVARSIIEDDYNISYDYDEFCRAVWKGAADICLKTSHDKDGLGLVRTSQISFQSSISKGDRFLGGVSVSGSRMVLRYGLGSYTALSGGVVQYDWVAQLVTNYTFSFLYDRDSEVWYRDDKDGEKMIRTYFDIYFCNGVPDTNFFCGIVCCAKQGSDNISKSHDKSEIIPTYAWFYTATNLPEFSKPAEEAVFN